MDNKLATVDFIEEIKQLKVEYGFQMRWTLLEMYHKVGEILVSHRDTPVEEVSKQVGISERDLYRSIQFVEKYPDINTLPDGKAASWHKVTNELLPEPQGKEKPAFKIIKLQPCETCGKWILPEGDYCECKKD